MAAGTSPTLRLWQLAESLRNHRDRNGFTIEQAAERLRPHSPRWSRSKLQRIETRAYAPQPTEVANLIDVYAISADEGAVLTEMAGEARQRGWWQSSALPKSGHLLVGLEQAATTIRQFELALVPGLLQTSDYVRAVLTATDPALPIEVAEGFVAARMIRQQVIKREEPVTFHAVVAEAALHCPVGGRRVMRGQLERLIDLAAEPHIAIQVLPLTAGAHPGMEGSFTLLTLAELDSDVGYVEGQMGAVYLESKDDVRQCTMRFAAVSALALSPADSRKLLTERLAEYQ